MSGLRQLDGVFVRRQPPYPLCKIRGHGCLLNHIVGRVEIGHLSAWFDRVAENRLAKKSPYANTARPCPRVDILLDHEGLRVVANRVIARECFLLEAAQPPSPKQE